MRIPVALMALGLMFFAGAAAAMPADEVQAWREDLAAMVTGLKATHKNLYHTISPEAFTAEVNDLDSALPSLTRAQAIVGMAKIVASVGDGHTNIYPTRDAKIGFHRLPVKFTWFGDQLYIRAVEHGQEALLGARVTAFGKTSVPDALTAVTAMVGHENMGGVRHWAQYLLAMPEVLDALNITKGVDDVRLVLEKDGRRQEVTLHPSSPVPVMSGDISTLFYPEAGWSDLRDAAPTPLWLRHVDMPFHFEHAGDLLYVQINTIGDAPGESFAAFAQRLHDEISASKPNKVVLDLRQNRGGDDTKNVALVRALIQSEEIDRPGHLFAIIGPATFSAAQMLTDRLENYTNVVFVGEASGSKGNAYGDSRKIVLPHSGITVRASIYYWQDWYPWDDRDATVPQLLAPLTFEAYRAGIDPALQAISDYRMP